MKSPNAKVATSHQIMGNTLLSSLSEMSLIFTFVFYILAARYLGDEAYGKFASALAFVGLFSMFVLFGFSYSITKIIVRDRDRAGFYAGNALSIQFFIAIALLLVSSGVAWLLRVKYPPEVRTVIAIVFLAESFRCFGMTLRSTCKALGRFHYDTLAVNAERIFLLIAGGVLLVSGKGVEAAAWVLLFSRAVSFFLLLGFLGRSGQKIRLKPGLSTCRMLVRQSWIYVLQSSFWTLNNYVDVVMLSLLRNFVEVGWYSVARRFFEGLWFVPNIITEAVYPELSARHLVSRELVVKLFMRSFKYTLIVATVITMCTVMAAPDLIRLAYGSEYEQSILVLVLLGIAVVPSFLRYLFGTTLIAVNQQKKVTMLDAVRSALNIVLNLILIVLYGYIGAAVTTVVMEYLTLIAYFLVLKKEGLIRRKALGFSLKPLLAAALLFAGYTLFQELSGWIKLAGVFVLYWLLLFMMKIFDREELRIFKTFLMKLLWPGRFNSGPESSGKD